VSFFFHYDIQNDILHKYATVCSEALPINRGGRKPERRNKEGIRNNFKEGK
jgi:hypothetical protein